MWVDVLLECSDIIMGMELEPEQSRIHILENLALARNYQLLRTDAKVQYLEAA